MDRCKASRVNFLNLLGCAKLSHTGLERSAHHGLEVGARLQGVQLTFNMAN